jgi:hypothetical protein
MLITVIGLSPDVWWSFTDVMIVSPCLNARRRRHPEDEHAGQEQPPAAEQVGQPPAQQQEPAGHQPVAADHPREALLREVQIVLDPREGGVHHGDVENEHQLHRRENGQRPPPPRIGFGGARRRAWRILACDAHEIDPPCHLRRVRGVSTLTPGSARR